MFSTSLSRRRLQSALSARSARRSSVALLGGAAVAILGIVGGAAAAPATTLPAPVPAVGPTGSVTAHVAEDTYSVPNAKNRVTGAYAVTVAGDSGSDRRTTYLKFVVQAVPADALHVDATLRLTTGTHTVPGATVQVFAAASTWSQSSLTAANAPVLGSLLGSAAAAQVAGGRVLVDVGAVGNGTVSYAVSSRGPAGSSIPFVSSEGGAGSAQLTIAYTLPPSAPELGESVYRDGLDWDSAVARSDAKYGRSAIDRVYYGGLPAPWPGTAGSIDRDVVVSFKADPRRVSSGALDATLTGWFGTAPTDREIYWSYFHEPEDQIAAGAFTAADYRAAWAHVAKLARASGNSHLHATLILMAWTLNPKSGRTFADYYPGSDVVDVLGWDAYALAADAARGTYTDPATVFGPAVSVSQTTGKPFGFAEWGSVQAAGDAGARRAAWITASAGYQRTYGALWSTYFDSPVGAEYRLLDAPGIAAFRRLVAGT
jgi:hypothetical protein